MFGAGAACAFCDFDVFVLKQQVLLEINGQVPTLSLFQIGHVHIAVTELGLGWVGLWVESLNG
jgi:hypothetical protein